MRTEKDLAAFLDAERVPHEIVVVEAETPTVEAAAAALAVAPDAIVKSVLFADRESPERFTLVVARGLTRVDKERLARHVPGRWRMASPDEVLRVTGYAAGAVPPVGHATPLPVVMDVRVHAMPELWGGGGGHRAMLRIARADVERLTRASVHDVCYEP